METTNKQILVVDDDKHIRSALDRYFAIAGWTVKTACSGQDALEKMAGGSSFDVVVADYFMPNINGIEFFKQLNMKHPDVFCIMLTAYPYSDAIKFAMKKYLKVELLEKPWDEGLLRIAENAVEVQLQRRTSDHSS